MDVYLAIASKRDTRRYAERPIPDEVVERILDAGRLSGSARNIQPWRFIVVESRQLVEQLAETVYVATNVLGAALVVVLVSRSALDGGRAAQNMMLAAWNDGVASCPNGMPDPARTAALLRLGEDEPPLLVLTFGYTVTGRDPERHSSEEWSRRADRKPLAELVARI